MREQQTAEWAKKKKKSNNNKKFIGIVFNTSVSFGGESSFLYCGTEAMNLSSLIIILLQQSIDAIYLPDIKTRLSV